MSQNIKPTFIFIATLGILSMLPPLGVDMYIPSFLNIAEDLNINSEQVQHTLTFFAYGMDNYSGVPLGIVLVANRLFY